MGYKVTCSRCEKSISHSCGSVEEKSDFIIKGIEIRVHPSGRLFRDPTEGAFDKLIEKRKMVPTKVRRMDIYQPIFIGSWDDRVEWKGRTIYPEPRVINLRKNYASKVSRTRTAKRFTRGILSKDSIKRKGVMLCGMSKMVVFG